MKTNCTSERIGAMWLALIVAVTLTSCATSLDFLPSTVVPGAEGKVTVKNDKNKNYAIDVNVHNLAEPTKLASPKPNYVVWMETAENGVQNLGRLATNQNLFSKGTSASIETVSPYRPVKFMITAEDQIDARYPGNQIVLQTETNQKR